MGQSIPLVCQDWANAKAAYRFFSNERVNEADILAGHLQSTRDRTAASDGLIPMLHDTTEFSYQREKPEAIGITKAINSGRDHAGRLRSHTVCGILCGATIKMRIRFAVGTLITERPPHRSTRAAFPHVAPTAGV